MLFSSPCHTRRFTILKLGEIQERFYRNWEEAEKYYSNATRIDPDRADAWFYLGQHYRLSVRSRARIVAHEHRRTHRRSRGCLCQLQTYAWRHAVAMSLTCACPALFCRVCRRATSSDRCRT